MGAGKSFPMSFLRSVAGDSMFRLDGAEVENLISTFRPNTVTLNHNKNSMREVEINENWNTILLRTGILISNPYAKIAFYTL